MDMQEMIINKELFGAYVKFQTEFNGMKADSSNPFFKSTYISLDGILNTIRPILAKNGLAIIQNLYTEEEHITVQTMLVHSSGQYYITKKLSMRPNKPEPQVYGSMATYMKRYQLASLIGVCESIDDDGNVAHHGSYSPAENIQAPKKATTPKKSEPEKEKDYNITQKQGQRLFAIANNTEKLKGLYEKYGYEKTMDIKKSDYDKMIAEIEEAKQNNLW